MRQRLESFIFVFLVVEGDDREARVDWGSVG